MLLDFISFLDAICKLPTPKKKLILDIALLPFGKPFKPRLMATFALGYYLLPLTPGTLEAQEGGEKQGSPGSAEWVPASEMRELEFPSSLFLRGKKNLTACVKKLQIKL